MEDFYIDYASMDDIQRAYIQRKTDRHMVVTGTAGSGKSVIALHKLRQVCTNGTYAIVVFTKSLKKYFFDGLADMKKDREENYGEILNIDDNKIFYYAEWKKWHEHNPECIVDYLIVDECQDFSSEEINELLSFGKICFLFGDATQTIMDFGEKITMDPQNTAGLLGVVIDKLYRNYRLTIENAKVVEQVPVPEVKPDISNDCIRHGEKPRLIRASSFDSQLDKIINIINNQSLSNVGILLRFNRRSSSLNYSGSEKRSVEYVKDYFEGKGVTVEYKYNINLDTEMDLDFHSSNPKILTWWCAKGLQFKDVFIVDCDYDYVQLEKTPKDKRRLASAWYVALSRTSERLYLGFVDDLVDRFPKISSDLYANPINDTDDDELPF